MKKLLFLILGISLLLCSTIYSQSNVVAYPTTLFTWNTNTNNQWTVTGYVIAVTTTNVTTLTNLTEIPFKDLVGVKETTNNWITISSIIPTQYMPENSYTIWVSTINVDDGITNYSKWDNLNFVYIQPYIYE